MLSLWVWKCVSCACCLCVVQPWKYFKGKMLNQAQTKTLMLRMRTQNKRYVSWSLCISACVSVCRYQGPRACECARVRKCFLRVSLIWCAVFGRTPLITHFKEWLINDTKTQLITHFHRCTNVTHLNTCIDNTHTHGAAVEAAEGEQTRPAEGIHQTDVPWTWAHFFHLFPPQFYIRGYSNFVSQSYTVKFTSPLMLIWQCDDKSMGSEYKINYDLSATDQLHMFCAGL